MPPEPITRWITVNRKKFTLVLHKLDKDEWQLFEEKRYPVAVGAIGHDTPAGLYLINSRAKCPEWTIPDSQWAIDAGLKPGTIVEGCTEANPLKLRWLGITEPAEGVGIHGTSSRDSIGTAASHGCIRMREEDVVELFDLVKLYTPIRII